MNPKDFDWAENQQVTVTNPTAEPFTWQVHGKEYSLGPGLSASMPGYLAWVYVYNQATKMAQADKKFDQWNDIPVRKEYFAKFVAGVQPIIQEVTVEKSLVETLDDTDTPELPTGGESYTPASQKAPTNATKAPTV